MKVAQVPTYSQGYMEVLVQNPVTTQHWQEGRYTSYEVLLETNNRAFNLRTSKTRRRYSEFRWFRTQLRKHFPDISPPTLPPRKFFGKQFGIDVIKERMTGLQEFLTGVLEEPVYLSDSVLHLFLQTGLSIAELLDCVENRTRRGVLETILQANTRRATSPLGNSFLTEVDPENLDDSENSIVSSSMGSINNAPATLQVPCQPYHRSQSTPLLSALASSYGPSSYASSIDSSMDSPMSCSLPHSRKIGTSSRRVTFSQEVTVAEVIDKCSRNPSHADLLQHLPSADIAGTTAY